MQLAQGISMQFKIGLSSPFSYNAPGGGASDALNALLGQYVLPLRPGHRAPRPLGLWALGPGSRILAPPGSRAPCPGPRAPSPEPPGSQARGLGHRALGPWAPQPWALCPGRPGSQAPGLGPGSRGPRPRAPGAGWAPGPAGAQGPGPPGSEMYSAERGCGGGFLVPQARGDGLCVHLHMDVYNIYIYMHIYIT